MKNVFVHLSLLLALVFSLSNCKHVGLSETRAILGTKNGTTYYYKMAKDNKNAICRYTCDSLTQFDPNTIARSCSSSPVYMTESQVMIKNYEAIKAHIGSPKTVIYTNEENTLEEALFFDAFNTIYEQSKNNPNLFALGSPIEVCGGVAATTVTQTPNSSNANVASENSKGIVVVEQSSVANTPTQNVGWKKVSTNEVKDLKTGITWRNYPSRVSYDAAKRSCSSFGGRLPSEGELGRAINNGIDKQLDFSFSYYWTTTAGVVKSGTAKEYWRIIDHWGYPADDAVWTVDVPKEAVVIVNVARSDVDEVVVAVKRTENEVTRSQINFRGRAKYGEIVYIDDERHSVICMK